MRNDAFPNDILHSTTLTLETTATLAPPPLPSFSFHVVLLDFISSICEF